VARHQPELESDAAHCLSMRIRGALGVATLIAFVGCDGFVRARVQVVSTQGETIPDALIRQDRPTDHDLARLTDDKGCAYFSGVVAPVRSVAVTVGKAGYQSQAVKLRTIQENCLVVHLARDGENGSSVDTLASENCPCDSKAGYSPFAAELRSQQSYRISGRVVDSHGSVPTGVEFTIGKEEGEASFGSHPVQLGADGSFVSRPLVPATYVLEVRPSASSKDAKVEGGLAIVTLRSSDLAEVMLRTRPGFAVTGRFRMESDNPAAAWPPIIVVNALVAVDGAGMLGASVAEGAPGGAFVFRNVYGPRVLRSGYTPAPGARWSSGRVLLDGVDITDVPTELSEAQNARLEVVFTQHPARFAGTIRDSRGKRVPEAWVVVFSAERARWQRWSAVAQAIRADSKGAFDFTALPGRYLVRALSPETFPIEGPRALLRNVERRWLRDFERLSQGGTTVQLNNRERKMLSVTINGR
jgi:hypothetical protein